jgi:hypothetical protein
LDDSARPGKTATIKAEAKAWLVSLACQKTRDFGYPHEVWTTRLLARHAREYGPAAGQEYLARLVQGTVCKILDAHAIKPHKIRYYLERRDPEFEEKMTHVLCIYRKVAILKEANAPSDTVAISFLTMKNPACKTARTCRRNPAFMRPSHVITSISAMAR